MLKLIKRLRSRKADERGDALLEGVVGSVLVGMTVAVIFGALNASTEALAGIRESGNATRAVSEQIDDFASFKTCKSLTRAVSNLSSVANDDRYERYTIHAENLVCTPGTTASIDIYAQDKVTRAKYAKHSVTLEVE